MRVSLRFFAVLLAVSVSNIPLLAAERELAAPAGPYLGQKEPGLKPEVFAPGIVSLPGRREGTCTFSPDGRAFYFTVVAADGAFAVHEMLRREGGWTPPRRASFAAWGSTGDPFFTADGKRLYFGSTRPPGGPPWNGRIWSVERAGSGEGWGEPKLLELGIDTEKGLGFPTVSARGILWFGTYAEKSTLPNLGKSDVYFVDANKTPLVVQNPGAPVNSPHEEWDPFIAPDGSYLLFESDRPGGVGNIDIWVSFRDAQGKWGEPINLGPEVNTRGVDVAAKVTWDGKFLFFDRPRPTEQDPYWVSAEVVTRLRPK